MNGTNTIRYISRFGCYSRIRYSSLLQIHGQNSIGCFHRVPRNVFNPNRRGGHGLDIGGKNE